ncbi:DUF1491 family protein [Rhodospirillales bacterium]|nr:DUF1491 family protein [Rhodospirillales bacterium]
MREPALKAGIWINAQVRLCNQRHMPAMVRRRGDSDAGSILIIVDQLDGTAYVLSQIRDADGVRNWLKVTGDAPVPYAQSESYIQRRAGTDPDIWVLEIEDKDGAYTPDAPVVI